MLSSIRPIAVTLILLTLPAVSAARDQVSVVGSSTLYPLAKAIALHASESPDGGDFRIESTGTVAGIGLFCAGADLEHPDVLNASRRMRGEEMEACKRAGVDEVVEVKVGYDGITLATGADAADIQKDPDLIGIFGFHFYDASREQLKAIPIDGVAPSLSGIADGSYALSRPLYVYFKKTNLERLPGIERYIQEFTSEPAWSETGYLRADGLIPMLLEERQKYAYIADNLVDPGCPPFCR